MKCYDGGKAIIKSGQAFYKGYSTPCISGPYDSRIMET